MPSAPSSSRAAIQRELARSADGLTVAQLAEELGLHHTAVRRHLRRLAAAGAVSSRTEHDGGRGRPRAVFQGDDPVLRTAEAHRTLVRLLLELLDESEIGPADVEAFGASIAPRTVRPTDVRRGLIEEMARWGFAPEEVGDADDRAGGVLRVRLRHCPFRSAVEGESGDLVCVLHRGLAVGLAEATRGRLQDFQVREPSAGACTLAVGGLFEAELTTDQIADPPR